MKIKIILICALLNQLYCLAQDAGSNNVQAHKEAFHKAYSQLKDMLEGKDSLGYEKAVFTTENAYYNNAYNYTNFKDILDFYTYMINLTAENARQQHADKFKTLTIYQQKMFMQNTANWAIYHYITDTTFLIVDNNKLFTKPCTYSTDDPYGSEAWENTQVLHLLASQKGNCYALASLFKIFSDRLQSDARLTVAPNHIYIENRNAKGDFKNVELTTKTFPGDGSIQTLTYTTHELIMNGMAQRMLNDTSAVALNLIYLAKGYEHAFNNKTDDFILNCANLALKHDPLSLNALLLKAELTENRLVAAMSKNKTSTVAQARKNVNTQTLLTNFEKQLSNLHHLGYIEIPKDIQHILLSAMQGNKGGYITTDKTPNPFASIGKQNRYATLSWGVFDEMHYNTDTLKYLNTSFDTKKKKIIAFENIDSTLSNKVDPVVFACSVDPLTSKHPNLSPYLFADNTPIMAIDLDGLDKFKVTVTPNSDDPKLTKIDVVKIERSLTTEVVYIHNNPQGVNILIEAATGNFKEGSVEEYYMNQQFSNTGKTNAEAMNVSTTINGNFRTVGNLIDPSSEGSFLVGATLFQYDLNIFFNPNKSEISENNLQPGTFDQAKSDISDFKDVLSNPLPYKSVNGKDKIANFNNYKMVVNGETDANSSNYKGCGNPCLGQDRADNLLKELEPAHPNNNGTNVINHRGEAKSEDRKASIFITNP